MKKIMATEIDKFVQKHEKVILDCWADWCPPCKLQTSTFKRLREKGALDDIVTVKIDIEEGNNKTIVADRFETNTIPTIVFYENGERKAIVRTRMSAEEIREKITEMF